MRKINFGSLLVLMIAAPLICRAQSADDRYPFVRDDKVGFIDYQGHEIISPRFGSGGDTSHFNNGLAPVFEANRGFGYIDISGKFVIGPTMDWGWGGPFHDGIAGVMIVGKNGARNRPAWIDRSGQIVFSGTGTEGAYFSDGLMPMPRGGKWGFVNQNFQFAIKPQFDYAYEFSEGRAAVTINHKSGFIDTSGKIVITAKYDMAWPLSGGLALVRYDVQNGTVMTEEGKQRSYRYQYGYVDHQGNEVIPLQFPDATHFSEGYAMVVPSNFKVFGIIDKAGTFVHQPEFEAAEEFHEGLAVACMKGKCGYLDTSGSWVIQPTFSHAESFWHGLARVAWKDGDYGYIDKSGQTVWRKDALPTSGNVSDCFLSRAALDHEVPDGDLNGFVVLVERRRSHLDQSLIRTRPRRPYLEDFALYTQLISGSHGPWPAEFVEAGAHDAAGGLEVALDQQPHGDCSRVPTAGGQPTEYCVARGFLVEMERLRIKLGAKSLDSLLVDLQAPGAKGLPDGKVFEISTSHFH